MAVLRPFVVFLQPLGAVVRSTLALPCFPPKFMIFREQLSMYTFRVVFVIRPFRETKHQRSQYGVRLVKICEPLNLFKKICARKVHLSESILVLDNLEQ